MVAERAPWGDGIRVPPVRWDEYGSAVQDVPSPEPPTQEPVENVYERPPWGLTVPRVTSPTLPESALIEPWACVITIGQDIDAILSSLAGLPAALRGLKSATALNVLQPGFGQQKLAWARYTLDPSGASSPIQTFTISPPESTQAAVVTALRIDCESDVVEIEVRPAGDLAAFGAVYSSGTDLYLRRDVLDRDLLAALGGFVVLPVGGSLQVILSNTSPYEVVVSISAITFAVDPKLVGRLAMLRTAWQEG